MKTETGYYDVLSLPIVMEGKSPGTVKELSKLAQWLWKWKE